MASSTSGPTAIETLPPRPPTPPRDTSRFGNTLDLGLRSLAGESPGLRPSLQTPPTAISPTPSGATNSIRSSGNTAKRVGWSAKTQYQEPPDYSTDKPRKSSPLSAPSSASSKPIKGILKHSAAPGLLVSSLNGDVEGSLGRISITEMLDSTIKQLAGADRDSRRDAYMMLARALKASNNLPDRVALQDKMSLLMQFIQRDVSAKKEDGSLDTSLVNYALSLLATFLHFPAIASTITSDFAVFIIDHCIRCFEDATLSKDVVRHFMQVVAFQNFPPKVMTLDRVGRLVASLHNIENHLMGKSIIMSRIQIYRRLIKQSRAHMLVHTDWLKDMFTDMLSAIRDIQAQAINLGMEAGYMLRPGTGTQLLRKITEILQTANEEQRYVDFYVRRLQEMVKDKQLSFAVPQVWSVIVLCLRRPLERWEEYGSWISLIQSAFNSADKQTKIEANYAWSRYIYVTLLDNRTQPKTLGTLCQPLLSQLRRRPNSKQPEENMKLRKTVISVFCTICYYGFRPGNDKNAPPELFWDFAVYPFISQLLGSDETRPDDILQASRILIGLLDVSTPVVWREDRIMDLPPVKPDELPSIESKWIRKNSDKIFKVVGPILERKFLDLANPESLVNRLWHALVGSVAAASAKDIKVSEDTAKFLACTLGLLSRIWSQGCVEGDEALVTKFYPSVQTMLKTLITGLGLLPFKEKKISMTVPNSFEPVATPSQRSDRSEKAPGVVRNSLNHLFSILSAVPGGGSDDEPFAEFFLSTFGLVLAGKDEKVRQDLTRDLLRLLPPNALAPYPPWVLGSQVLEESFNSKGASVPPSTDKLLGPEFREVVSHLEIGLSSHPNLPAGRWLALFNCFAQHVTAEIGDAGRALAVTDPLAKVLLGHVQGKLPQQTSKDIRAIIAVVESAKFPHEKQALEVVRKKLWGAVPTSKAGSLGLFDHLYKLLNFQLKYIYDNIAAVDADTEIVPFLNSVSAFMTDSFASTGFESMTKLQDGLSLWFQDEKTQLSLNNGDSPLSVAVRKLWSQVGAELRRHDKLTQGQFEKAEQLLTAAFKSKHRYMVNSVAETWNTIAKDQDQIECSDSLKSVVSSLRSKVDIVLPGGEQSSGDFGAQVASFVSSGDGPSPIVLSGTTNEAESQLPALPPLPSINHELIIKGPMTRKRQLQLTPDLETAKSKKRVTRSSRTSTPRLRHDNSQIQFETIPSSSPAPGESQHLTERQKEIRERQMQEAGMYTSISKSPQPETDIAREQTSKNEVAAKSTPQKHATPEKASSYEEIISSTPTPRRGQLIIMDEANDPPSSPPEPRPCPLLSEIRSRSRSANSLKEWEEFSSPPGTPVPNRQTVVPDLGTSPVVLTGESVVPQKKVPAKPKGVKTRSSRRTSLRARKNANEADVESPQPDVLDESSQESNVPEASNVGEDESADAPKDAQPRLPGGKQVAPKDGSFGLSDGDESQMMKFIVELESQRGQLALDKFHSISPEKPRKIKNEETDVAAQPEAASQEAPLPSTPQTGADADQENDDEGEEVSQSGKRKRKRPSRSSASRGRKRHRSVDKLGTPIRTPVTRGQSAAAVPASEPGKGTPTRIPVTRGQSVAAVPASEPEKVELPRLRKRSAPSTPVGVRTRRSARKEEQELEQKTKEEGLQKAEQNPTELEDNNEVDGDTDEEIMSQLLSESNAVSQTEERPDAEEHVEVPSTIEDSMSAGGSTEKESNEKGKVEDAAPSAAAGDERTAESQTESILEKLGSGLDSLRMVSLSRTDVNKIEDMLMDMKRALYAAEQRGRDP